MKLLTLALIAFTASGQTKFTGPITSSNGTGSSLNTYDWAEGRFPALQSWDAAIANVDSLGSTARAKVLWIGDSWSADGAEQLRYALQKNYPDGGYGFRNMEATATGQGFPGSVVRGGVWTDTQDSWTGSFGPGSTITSSSDTTATATYNITSPCQSVTIFYINQTSGGSFQYRRTASGTTGAFTTQNTTGTNNTLGSITVSSGSPAISSVDIQMISGNVKIVGVYIDAGGPGITVNNIGRAGSKASSYAAADVALWELEIAAIGANLVIIEFGANELLQQNTSSRNAPADQIAAITTLVSWIQATIPDAGIILVPQAHIADSLGSPYKLKDYVNAQEAYAAANGLGFFSMYKILTPYDSPYAGGRQLWNNNYHYSQRGARLCMNVLGSWMMVASRH